MLNHKYPSSSSTIESTPLPGNPFGRPTVVTRSCSNRLRPPVPPNHTTPSLSAKIEADRSVNPVAQTVLGAEQAERSVQVEISDSAFVECRPHASVFVGPSRGHALQSQVVGNVEPDEIRAIPPGQPVAEEEPDASTSVRRDHGDRRERILLRGSLTGTCAPLRSANSPSFVPIQSEP